MKVECATNKFKDIPKTVYDELYGYSFDTELPIEIGQQSVVYGITTIKKHLWYLVNVEGLADPMYYPCHLFKIIDGRLSKYWMAKEGQDYYDNNASIINFGFKEIVEEEYFYGELIEDNPINVSIFRKYKELMDREYTDPE
jgi:hypothetical protein